MNDQEHTQLDAALEALARPEPPAEHVVLVLARSGPQAGDGLPAAGHLRLRWMLPVAATVVAALGMTWQLTRQIERRLDAEMAGSASATTTADTSASGPSQPHGWGAPQEMYRPSLPPQANWGTDALEEWKSLRTGSGSRESGFGSRASGTARPARRPEAAMAWVPVPTGLPPIELESIVPAPVDVPPLAPLEDIALADIPVEPIVIAPLIEEERP